MGKCIGNLNNCDCEIIDQVEQIKYLGVIIDQKISWKPRHVNHLQNELRKTLESFIF